MGLFEIEQGEVELEAVRRSVHFYKNVLGAHAAMLPATEVHPRQQRREFFKDLVVLVRGELGPCTLVIPRVQVLESV